MNMEKNNINVNTIAETLGDAVKLAANLTESAKNVTKLPPSDNSNNTQSNPNQTVQIQIADPSKKEEPKHTVVYKKPETHIHKDFPDNRALTDAECQLALKKAEMEWDLKMKQQEYDRERQDAERRDRLAREAQDRKIAEEKRIKEEKKAKIRGIVGGIFAALGVGLVGYSMYADHMDRKNGIANKSKLNVTISGEGKVE